MSKVFFCKNCNKFARILDDSKCEVCRMSIDEINFLVENHPEFFKQNKSETSESELGSTETKIIEIQKQEIQNQRDILLLEKQKNITVEIDTDELIEKQIKEEEEYLAKEEIELERKRKKVLLDIQLEEERSAKEEELEEIRLAEEKAEEERLIEEARLVEEKEQQEAELEKIRLAEQKAEKAAQKTIQLEEAKLLKEKEKAEKAAQKTIQLEEAKLLKEKEKVEKAEKKQLLLEQIEVEKNKTKQLLLEQIEVAKTKQLLLEKETKKLEEEAQKAEEERLIEEARLAKEEAEETKKLEEEAQKAEEERLIEEAILAQLATEKLIDTDTNALIDTQSIDLDIDQIIEPNFDASLLKENNSTSKSKLIESMDLSMDDLSSWDENSEETINLKDIDITNSDESQELDVEIDDFDITDLDEKKKNKIIAENDTTISLENEIKEEPTTITQVSTTTVLTSRLNLESVKTSANALMDKIIKFLTEKKNGKPVKNPLAMIGNLSFLDKNDKKKFIEIWKKMEFISSLNDESKISKEHIIQIFDAEIYIDDIILLN